MSLFKILHLKIQPQSATILVNFILCNHYFITHCTVPSLQYVQDEAELYQAALSADVTEMMKCIEAQVDFKSPLKVCGRCVFM